MMCSAGGIMSTVLGKVNLATFYDSSIGKKAVMAVTGLILFGFLIAHMLGNLQVFLGREVMNHYAETLHGNPSLLWTIRIVLLLSVLLHIWASIQLTIVKSRARPVQYVKRGNVQSSYASRTMMWSGPIIAAFVIYHLLHFTTGWVHPNFVELRPYENVINGFRVIPATVAYVIAMVLVGFHLSHGIWSMFQSLGLSHPRYTPMIKAFAAVFSWALVAGFLSVPAAVLLGLVR
jgi:succinate dehydrogenase / fumarate reductase cytochrome b subunit